MNRIHCLPGIPTKDNHHFQVIELTLVPALNQAYCLDQVYTTLFLTQKMTPRSRTRASNPIWQMISPWTATWDVLDSDLVVNLARRFRVNRVPPAQHPQRSLSRHSGTFASWPGTRALATRGEANPIRRIFGAVAAQHSKPQHSTVTAELTPSSTQSRVKICLPTYLPTSPRMSSCPAVATSLENGRPARVVSLCRYQQSKP